jgi:hypothetical protein
MSNDTTSAVIARLGPRRLAEAIMSPSSLLLGGAVGGIAIAAAGPVGLVAGVAAWLFATTRKLKPKEVLRGASAPKRIDPFAINDPWRASVMNAMGAQMRFDRAVDSTSKGALRERLAGIRDKVGEAVEQCWTIAVQGDQLDDAIRELDVRDQANNLKIAEEQIRRNSDPNRVGSLEARRDAIRSQLESANRLVELSQSTEDRLRQLNAQLDELVVRGIELSVTGSSEDLNDLGIGVDSVLTEMEAVRQAMTETNRISRGRGPQVADPETGTVATG